MKWKLLKMQAQRVVYKRRHGAYGSGNKELMEEMKAWINRNGLFCENSVILGIAWDNPVVTPPENCRYDVCLLWKEGDAVPGSEVSEAELPGGSYIVFTVEHTAEGVQKAWSDGVPMLTQEGYRLDDTRPAMERYKESLICQHLCEICIPVCSGDPTC